MAAKPVIRAAKWTSVPMEKSLHIDSQTPSPDHKLPKQSALVKVEYVSINPVDYKVPEFALARLAGIGKIPGCDFAGTVIETNLEHIAVGDRVSGFTSLPAFGALAEQIVVQGRESIAKIPDNIVELSDAATLGIAAMTALQCIKPRVRGGEKVVIRGASGGTGVFGIQIAKILGCHVTAICSGANAELCKSLGADEIIDYRSVDPVKELAKSGPVYDLLVDNVDVGGPFLTQAHTYLKSSGQYVTIAGAPSLSSAAGLFQTVAPSWLGGSQRKAKLVACEANSADLSQLLAWLAEHKLKINIEKIYEFDQVGGAFERLKSGRTRGKLVVKVA